MLITSDPILPGEELQHRDATSESKYGTYVHELSRSEHWARISPAAKSFIKNCLRIDEKARLTAASALEHEWFTHADYREDFDKAYQRAIQSWRPRERSGRESLVEMIDTSGIMVTPRAAVAPHTKRQGNYEHRCEHFIERKKSPLRPVQSNACRVQKPPPLRASAVGVRGARSPPGLKMSKASLVTSGIFASSIAEQLWRPL
jgi:serine/threonine protein kinase